MIDITTLSDWPDYPPGDTDRFADVDWAAACEIALELVDAGGPWCPIDVPRDLPDSIRVGLELLLVSPPIDVTPRQLTDGGHRLAAMRSQGVRYTVGVLPSGTARLHTS